MKKRILSLFLFVGVLSTNIMAQTYSELWKQLEKAEQDDLPNTERAILGKIIKKAEREGHYGHLLKALLKDGQAAAKVSGDSLEVAVERLKIREQQAKSRPLQAVYDAVLSRIYKQNYVLKDAYLLSKEYTRKALENPKELAATKIAAFTPFVIKGKDSEIFDNDLLSLIGMETEQYEQLHAYYLTTKNRPAQLLTALKIVPRTVEKYDSLIARYGDLVECGEAAIDRYYSMNSHVSAKERIDYIDEALKRWGSWKRMDNLRNERYELTALEFHAHIPQAVCLPNKKQTVMIRMRGIQQLTTRIYRVKADGNFDKNPSDKEDYKAMKSLLTPLKELTDVHPCAPHPEYEFFEDSIELQGLPAGVYMLEMETLPKTTVDRQLLYVSDVRVLTQTLPDDQTRYVVVNATTGLPIGGAQLRLKENAWRDNGPGITVTCNAKGEYIHDLKKQQAAREVFATTKDDRYCPPLQTYQPFYGNDGYNKNRDICHVFTDRAIYRPGQTVRACAIVYQLKNGYEHQTKAHHTATAILRNTNYEVVGEKEIVTDDFGTAAFDFTLPTTGLTGEYYIEVDNGRYYFSVEEYKRPTFQVEMEKPLTDYKAGDTLTIKGKAVSYAGVPVQNARVSYTVERKVAFWWMSYMRYWDGGRFGSGEYVTPIHREEVFTDDEGNFEVRLPLLLPEEQEGKTMFYNFVVTADVTDMGGETRHGELSLPLGNRKTAFSIDLTKQMLKEKMPVVVFHLRNAAGTELNGTVSYRIDGKKWQQTEINTPLTDALHKLQSGKHQIEAVCNGDTLKQEFVVFSLDDKRPATETQDWFFISADQFANDGTPVTLQVGSSAKDVYMVYTITANKKVIESGAVKKSNELLNRKFTYKEEYGDGMALSFAWYKAGKAYKHTATIRRPLPDKRLKLRWETFRDRLTPGQQEEWTVKIEAPATPSSLSTLHAPLNYQLLATLYDKSLDQIRANHWSFALAYSIHVPAMPWIFGEWGETSLSGRWRKDYLIAPSLSYNRFDHRCFPHFTDFFERGLPVFKGAARRSSRGPVPVNQMMMKSTMNADEAIGAFDVAAPEMADAKAVETEQEATETNTTNDEVMVRENLQETAFFYPQLTADSTGLVALKFTLPESLTTWRFMGLAHTTDMMYGMLEDEAVAKKEVMIQPNMPRFVRTGDEATLSARIFNTTEKDLNGIVTLTLSDAESNRVIFSQQATHLLPANKSTAVSFPVSVKDFPSLLVCKMTVASEGHSDGEQHYLPVLPNRERVTVTVPFTQTQPGTKTIDIAATVPATSTDGKLTFEYTNNPAWLIMQALPSVGHPHDNCVICQASAFYANSLGRYIMSRNPQAKHIIEKWKQEDASLASLHSQLEKNEELKDLVLSETPWVMDADREAEQKSQLADFFDANLMESRINASLKQLQELQNSDGSWSWWKGMDGSFYMTVEISEMLVRLSQMTGEASHQNSPFSILNSQLDKAFGFMDKVIIDMVNEMRKQEKKGIRQTFPSHKALQYLYMSTLADRKLSGKAKEAQIYLKGLLKKEGRNLTIYDKAMASIVLNSPTFIKSLLEWTTYKEGMGRYYDTPRASYSWRDYRIPTQVAAIEAFKRLTPNDKKTIREMQEWLLQEKRTQAWDTPINSVDAIYAFLMGNEESLKPQPQTVLKVDGKTLETSEATAGIGYVKTSMQAKNVKTFTAEKTSTGTSWGAVYAQFMQDTKDISSQGSEISVKREIMKSDRSPLSTLDTPLKVGDRIRVRITIETKRDLDFVQLIDKRAACMEPINQLSGYQDGAYAAPRDNATQYFFNCLPKGKHYVETEYYIDRAGTYETGTCTVQCAYAPEFRATTQSVQLRIKN